MKRFLIISLFLIGTFFAASSKQLKEGEQLNESIIVIPFSDAAKATDSYITWELEGDWSQFDFSFSQGNLSSDGRLYTIYANEYKDRVFGLDGIAIVINGMKKPEAKQCHLDMVCTEVSDNLQLDGYSKDELDVHMTIDYIREPFWLRHLVAEIICVVLILILLLVLNVTAKFPGGLLQLNRDEIMLKGRKSVSLKEELSNNGIDLEEGADVILVKKRFGTFNGPCIKEIKNCLLERDGELLSKGAIILDGEEIHGLKDINGVEIIIRFC